MVQTHLWKTIFPFIRVYAYQWNSRSKHGSVQQYALRWFGGEFSWKLFPKSMRGIQSDRAPTNAVLYLLCTLTVFNTDTPKCQQETRINCKCMADGINRCMLNVYIWELDKTDWFHCLLGKWYKSWQTIPKISIFKFDAYFHFIGRKWNSSMVMKILANNSCKWHYFKQNYLCSSRVAISNKNEFGYVITPCWGCAVCTLTSGWQGRSRHVSRLWLL